jgi:hypothetical protein
MLQHIDAGDSPFNVALVQNGRVQTHYFKLWFLVGLMTR